MAVNHPIETWLESRVRVTRRIDCTAECLRQPRNQTHIGIRDVNTKVLFHSCAMTMRLDRNAALAIDERSETRPIDLRYQRAINSDFLHSAVVKSSSIHPPLQNGCSTPVGWLSSNEYCSVCASTVPIGSSGRCCVSS